jgi:hypothetical protein
VHREEVQVLVGSLVAYLQIQKDITYVDSRDKRNNNYQFDSVHAMNTKSIDCYITCFNQTDNRQRNATCHETLETLVAHRRLGDRVDAGRQHAQSGSFEDSDLEFAAGIFSKLFGLVVVGPVNRRCVEPVSYLVHLNRDKTLLNHN